MTEARKGPSYLFVAGKPSVANAKSWRWGCAVALHASLGRYGLQPANDARFSATSARRGGAEDAAARSTIGALA
jgi:hypothetical protein